MTTAQRGAGGQLKKGVTLNPSGVSRKRLGERKKAGQLIDDNLVDVTRAAIELALLGDAKAQKLILERGNPVPKPTMPLICFPMPEDGDLAEQSAAVVVACSKGQIPPDIATMLCQSLLSIAQLQDKRLVETIEELQRLLDEQHSGKTQ